MVRKNSDTIQTGVTMQQIRVASVTFRLLYA